MAWGMHILHCMQGCSEWFLLFTSRKTLLQDRLPQVSSGEFETHLSVLLKHSVIYTAGKFLITIKQLN